MFMAAKMASKDVPTFCHTMNVMTKGRVIERPFICSVTLTLASVWGMGWHRTQVLARRHGTEKDTGNHWTRGKHHTISQIGQGPDVWHMFHPIKWISCVGMHTTSARSALFGNICFYLWSHLQVWLHTQLGLPTNCLLPFPAASTQVAPWSRSR